MHGCQRVTTGGVLVGENMQLSKSRVSLSYPSTVILLFIARTSLTLHKYFCHRIQMLQFRTCRTSFQYAQRPPPIFLARSFAAMASSSSSIEPQTLPMDVLIEEETCPNYIAADYYPMDPQQLLHERYKTVTKLGWGRCSTVWLAQDTKRYASMPMHTLICLQINNSTGESGGSGGQTSTWLSKWAHADMLVRMPRSTS